MRSTGTQREGDELVEAELAVAVRVAAPERVLRFLARQCLANLVHEREELLDRDEPIAVRVERVEGIADLARRPRNMWRHRVLLRRSYVGGIERRSVLDALFTGFMLQSLLHAAVA